MRYDIFTIHVIIFFYVWFMSVALHQGHWRCSRVHISVWEQIGQKEIAIYLSILSFNFYKIIWKWQYFSWSTDACVFDAFSDVFVLWTGIYLNIIKENTPVVTYYKGILFLLTNISTIKLFFARSLNWENWGKINPPLKFYLLSLFGRAS